jgi:hypothetical protein
LLKSNEDRDPPPGPNIIAPLLGALRNISMEDYEKEQTVSKKTTKPYERWMQSRS